MQPAIRVTTLSKSFGQRRALDCVNLEILPGEMVALIGASGSGKSTLLRHIAGLVCGDAGRDARAGEVLVHGRKVQCGGRLSPEIRRVRAGIGFVFQQFNLVGRLPLIVNVLTGMLHRLPLWRSLPRRFSREELRLGLEALARVGIAEQALQRASTLSGGQQQRGAIARTLVQGADIVLADEPIASLDPESSRRVMEILAAINREDRCTVLVSLHQVNVALKYCPRTVALRQGKVVYDGPSADLSPALLRELYGTEADEILSTSDHISALGPRHLEPALAARAA
jgi:phosphonate transport system ATP-binding protein